MDKSTLSNYGWVVIAVLVLSVMIALATPFGTYISNAVQSTTQGLFDVNRSALNSTGLITVDDQEFDVPNGNGGAGENGETGQTPVEPETPSEPEIIEYLGIIRSPDVGEKYTFVYKPGMTWLEYVASSYNNGLFSIDASGYVICNKTTDVPVGSDVLVKGTDVIEYPATYTYRPDKTITKNDLFDCSEYGSHFETSTHNGNEFCLHCGLIAK